MQPIQGIHHITAFASDPQRNVDFYHTLLGQRMVKTTINFDDPGTYHFYFADEIGTPGTVMTFFRGRTHDAVRRETAKWQRQDTPFGRIRPITGATD